jgi:hypothetical protein
LVLLTFVTTKAHFFKVLCPIIAEELKENLIKRVEELAAKVKEPAKDPNSESLRKLEDLLDKTFPLIR